MSFQKIIALVLLYLGVSFAPCTASAEEVLEKDELTPEQRAKAMAWLAQDQKIQLRERLELLSNPLFKLSKLHVEKPDITAFPLPIVYFFAPFANHLKTDTFDTALQLTQNCEPTDLCRNVAYLKNVQTILETVHKDIPVYQQQIRDEIAKGAENWNFLLIQTTYQKLYARFLIHNLNWFILEFTHLIDREESPDRKKGLQALQALAICGSQNWITRFCARVQNSLFAPSDWHIFFNLYENMPSFDLADFKFDPLTIKANPFLTTQLYNEAPPKCRIVEEKIITEDAQEDSTTSDDSRAIL